MYIDDNDFEILLTGALYKAAALDYGVLPDDEASVRPSLRFKLKMRALLRNPAGYLRNQRRPVYIRTLRTAAAVLITAILLFGAAMAVSPEVRATVGDWVRAWFSDHTEYRLPQENAAEMHDGWTFGYIPDGFLLTDSFIDELQGFYIYHNGSSEHISITISAGNSTIIDNEHSDFYQTIINGHAADIYESNTIPYPSMIILFDDAENVFIIISSEIEISEIIKIAENITK